MKFDLSDVLIVGGAVLFGVYLYLLVGWVHLIGAAGVAALLVGIRLGRLARKSGGE